MDAGEPQRGRDGRVDFRLKTLSIECCFNGVDPERSIAFFINELSEELAQVDMDERLNECSNPAVGKSPPGSLTDLVSR